MNNDRSPFTLAEWAAIAAIILVWGVNNVAAKVATQALPPLFMGGARFAIALVLLIPVLIKPPWPPWRQALPVMLLAGPLHFGLVYVAFAVAHSLSPLVVALQLWIPMTTFFAWRILGETVRPAAILGMVVAFVGVAFMTLDPQGGADLPGICIGVVASGLWALATVLMRRTTAVRPLKMQALTSLAGAPALLAASAVFEPHLAERATHAGWFVWGLVVWAAVASTIGATALLFWLVQRREAGRVTPWFLLTPLVSCTFGVLMLHDRLSVQLVLGGGATLVGVALVALAERRAVVEAQASAGAA